VTLWRAAAKGLYIQALKMSMGLGGKRVARGGLQGAPPRPLHSLPPWGEGGGGGTSTGFLCTTLSSIASSSFTAPVR